MDSNLKYIYEHCVESSGSYDEEDYIDKTTMMQAVFADTERVEEHVLNFKRSIKGHRVLNRNRTRGHLTLMDDYFSPNALFIENFRWCLWMRKNVFDRLYNGV